MRGTCPLLEVADAFLHSVCELRDRLVKLSPDRLELLLDSDEIRRELVVTREERGQLLDVADLLVGERSIPPCSKASPSLR